MAGISAVSVVCEQQPAAEQHYKHAWLVIMHRFVVGKSRLELSPKWLQRTAVLLIWCRGGGSFSASGVGSFRLVHEGDLGPAAVFHRCCSIAAHPSKEPGPTAQKRQVLGWPRGSEGCCTTRPLPASAAEGAAALPIAVQARHCLAGLAGCCTCCCPRLTRACGVRNTQHTMILGCS